jgi:NAD(P)-dependent dehydrogenase (short-subunit alcohol dehydrogenase family)
MRLEGKRALITGAGSGIGRALAIEAARLGMTVALCGRRTDALYKTLTLMEPSGRHLRLQGDITDPAVRRGLRDYLWRHWGGLDVLVNNAGIVAVGPLTHTTDGELERVMATNVIAPAALSREMLPLLRHTAPSRIVNVGSMFGDIPYPLIATYSASKFALRGLSIALRRELKSSGIGVTYAAPRGTKTDAAHAFDPLIGPMQMRLDDPERVAAQIWRAVAQDADSAYAKGPERLFVLVQKLLPKLVDRSIAAQMADARILAYLEKLYDAAKARGRHRFGSDQPLRAAETSDAAAGADRFAGPRPIQNSPQAALKRTTPRVYNREPQHAD